MRMLEFLAVLLGSVTIASVWMAVVTRLAVAVIDKIERKFAIRRLKKLVKDLEKKNGTKDKES